MGVRQRHLVVHLPAFRLERCGFDADDVVALIAEERSAMRLQALTPAARALDLRQGMTASEARALVPDVQIIELDADAERQDWAALARAFGVLTDRVALLSADDLVLEISGTAHLWGGDRGAATHALELATELGHRVRVAVADDPLAARALAAWAADDGEAVVADASLAAELLAPLRLQALRPSRDLHDALRAVGVERIGQWARLDSSAVASRFGEEGVALHRVARGGVAGDSVDWAALDDDRPAVRASLGGATSTLQLHFVLPGLLSELAHKLGNRDLAVLRLRIVLRLEPLAGHSAVAAVGVRVGRPTRSPRILERLVRVRLEGLTIDSPVDELVLEAVEVVPDRGWQPGLTDRAEATEPLPDLMARLADHLGEDAAFAAQTVDAWRPEVSWAPEPYPPSIRPRSPPVDVQARSSDDPVAILEAFELGVCLPRPSLLLPEPARVEVGCQQGVPASVHLERGWVSVTRSAGPERLMGEWWAETSFARDYWVLEVDGRIGWWFHERNRWYLHGWFD